MKKRIFLLVLLTSLFIAKEGFSQINVSYHQSNLPFLAVGYEFSKWTPEFRLSTDVFTEDMSAEVVVPYKIIRKEDYYLDAGLGLRLGEFSGVLLPVGLSVFPFEKKQFGFHTEAALLTNIGSEVDMIFRGSWGITFRFRERQ
ncbi:hypothetical protein DXT99_06295 [Pontibacter diazotrophicus]|uniref:Outer membrane protein beta-barrel domain-containing protein n=1 Tax=Pontibacter diazotrophicus TaxID=1400979 RepID=A0A3D8LEW6_9BACT|nr:hypothetical protein [Pontibacter diazotrophicus]RDV15981.1 hypothetical protein DXT99_06295 [Pontibacter diazotrophicus]